MAGRHRHARASRGRFAWLGAAVLIVLYLGGFTQMPVSSAAFTATTDNSASAFTARATFGLTQTAGCFSDNGSGGCPTTASGIANGAAVVVSPDGKNVYTASVSGNAVAAFSRNATTGGLTPLANPNACLSNASSPPPNCSSATGLLSQVWDLAISPDGKHVYAAAYGSSTLVVFARNATTGMLSYQSCLYGNSAVGSCTSARGIAGANGVVVSPDGSYVYVTGFNSKALAVFARNTTSGALTQTAGANGCFTLTATGTAATCTVVYGIDQPYYLRTSPDNRSIYVAGYGSNAIAVLQRNMTTGVLTQPSAPNGCVYTGTGNANCTGAPGLTGAWHIGISPDGATVYGVGNTSSSVGSFSRNASTGVLTAIANPTVRAMTSPTGMAVSPDGLFAFVSASGSGGVAVFRRDDSTGVLTQVTPNASGCIGASANGCTTGSGLSAAGGIAISPDGRDVYVVGGASARGYVAVLNLTH